MHIAFLSNTYHRLNIALARAFSFQFETTAIAAADAKRAYYRLELAQINRALYTVKRAIRHAKQTPNQYVASDRAHAVFDSEPFRRLSCRNVAYEKFIAELLKCRQWADAHSLYRRMIGEKLEPSAQLRSKMLAVTVVNTTIASDDPVKQFTSRFSRWDVDDACLRQVIAILTEHHYDVEFVEKLINMYLDTRPAHWVPTLDFSLVMSELEVRAFKEHASIQENARMRGGIIPTVSRRDLATVYTTVLEDVARSALASSSLPSDILQRMQDRNVPLNANVLNALISIEVQKGRLEQAFELYRNSLADRSRDFVPNAHTYGLLFHIASKVFGMRRTRYRRYKRIKAVVSPRQMFREMLECHMIETCGRPQTRSSVMNTYVLNGVVAALLAQRDYIAAYVATTAFRMLAVRPNLLTYRMVLSHLTNRVCAAIRRSQHTAWVEHLLAVGREGVGRYAWPLDSPTDQLDSGASLEDHVTTRLLWLASGARIPMRTTEQQMLFTIDPDGRLLHDHPPRSPRLRCWLPRRKMKSPPPLVHPSLRAYTRFWFPTLSMLASGPSLFGGSPPDRARERFDWAPLRRIIQRAIQAGVKEAGGTSSSASDLVRQAKAELIVNPSKWHVPLRSNVDRRDRLQG